MTYAEMMIADWLERDDLQIVSLVDSVGSNTVSGIRAQSRALNWREIQLGGALDLEPTDQVFVFSTNDLGNYVPNRGDSILDNSGMNWTVVSVSQQNFAGVSVFYELASRKQV